MNIRKLTVLLVAPVLAAADGISINHDAVQPFVQPDPVTISNKSGVTYKPYLSIEQGCVPFPAVNAAGETSGGLMPTRKNSGCTEAPLGSQIYGRAAWYSGKWAIMYAWYFPKAFYGRFPTGRHDWTRAIVWIDNPDFPNASVRWLSLANAVSGYAKHVPPQEGVIENGTTPTFDRFTAMLKGYPENRNHCRDW